MLTGSWIQLRADQTIKISRTTGLFSGRMQVGKAQVKFEGVIMQGVFDFGAGSFTSGGLRSAMELTH